MEFRNQQAIYLQIADHVCEQILRRELTSDSKIASIRELAVELQVNPNTVVRTYTYLEEKGVIYKQRGVGYFVSHDAHKKTIALKRGAFLNNELPVLLNTMSLLDIDFAQLQKLVKQYGGEGIQ